MPWKKDYTFCNETSPTDIAWPQGKKAALTLVVDFSVPCGPEGLTEAAIAAAESFWGPGIRGERLLEFLDTWQLPATFAVPLAMAEAFPEQVAAMAGRGHEVAAGSFAKENVSGLGAAEEERRITQTLDGLEKIAGKRPTGWFSLPRTSDDHPGGSVSEATVDLLQKHGCRYFGNSMADDIPHYWVTDCDAPRPMLALPYYYALDAQFFIFFPGFGKGNGLMQSKTLLENWEREIQGALRYNRQAVLVMQPYLMQFGPALWLLERLGETIRNCPGLWVTTSGACAEYWLETYPFSKTARVEKLHAPEWA